MNEIIYIINLIFRSKVDNLQNKSNEVIGVFSKTVADLNKINEKIKTEQSVTDKKIENLILSKNLLNKQEETNTRIISKINDILS